MQHSIPEECISFYSLLATGQADETQVRRIKIDAPMIMQPCDIYQGPYGYLALHLHMVRFYLEVGVPFVVVVTTAAHARAVRALFHQLIQRRFPGEANRRTSRIKMLTGTYKSIDDHPDNVDDAWAKQFKTDPNDVNTLSQCDVLIYNTALQSGVSIETGYFQTAFEFLQNVLLTSRDEFQLTSRLRNIPLGKKFVWIQHSKDTVESKKYSVQQQARNLLVNTDNESMPEHVKHLMTIAWSVQVTELLHTRIYHLENYLHEYVRANGQSFTEVNIQEKPPDENGIGIDWIRDALNSELDTRYAAIRHLINPNNVATNSDDVRPMVGDMDAKIKRMIYDPDDFVAYTVLVKVWNTTRTRNGTADPKRHFAHLFILNAYLDLVSNNQEWQLRAQRASNPNGEFEAIIMRRARLLRRMLQALKVDPLRHFNLTINPRGLNQDNTNLANRMQAMRQFFHIEGNQGLDEHGHPTFAAASNLLDHPNMFRTYLAETKFNITSKVQTALARCGIPCKVSLINDRTCKYKVTKDKLILNLCALKAIVGPNHFTQYQPMFDQKFWNEVQQKYADLSRTVSDQPPAAASPATPSSSATPYSLLTSTPQTSAPTPREPTHQKGPYTKIQTKLKFQSI